MLEHATSGARGGGARPVIGREHELQEIERLLAGAREGFRALLLEGEAGIGKTTVFREALRRAEASCLKVLACRPGESEATLSFAALGDLLRGVPSEPWQALPAPQRRALEVAMLQIDPGERPADRRAVAAGVRSLVARLASDCPVLLAIDSKGVAEPRRPAREVHITFDVAPAAHVLEAGDRLHGPDQHRASVSLLPRHGIEAPVHPVDEVDVGAPRRPIQEAGAICKAGRRVAGRIIRTQIGLGLHDAPAHRSVIGTVLEDGA